MGDVHHSSRRALNAWRRGLVLLLAGGLSCALHAGSTAFLSAGERHELVVDTNTVAPLAFALTPGFWLLQVEERMVDVSLTAFDPLSGETILLHGIDTGSARIDWLIEAPSASTLTVHVTVQRRLARVPSLSVRLTPLSNLQPGGLRHKLLRGETALSRMPQQPSDADMRDALSVAHSLIDGWRELGDSTRAADATLNAAQLALRLGDYAPAATLADAAAQQYAALGIDIARGLALNVAGLAAIYRGDHDVAVAQLQLASALLAPVYEQVAVNPADSNLCFGYLRRRELDAAERCYLALLPNAALAGDSHSLGLLQNNLGGVYANRGQSLEAVQFLELALNQAAYGDATASRARLLNNIGSQYRLLGRVQDALNNYQQSLRIYRDIGDQSQIARLLGNIGAAYGSLGVPQQALPFLKEAYALRRPAADALSVHAAIQLAAAHRELGDLDAARERLKEAITVSTGNDDRLGNLRARISLGGIELEAGSSTAALDLLASALADARAGSDNPRMLSLALHHYGRALAEAGNVEAIQILDEGLALRRLVGDRLGEAATLTVIAWSRWNRRDVPAAIQAAREAIALIETQRIDIASPDLRASYQSAVAGAYEVMIYCLMHDGEADAALQVAERFRAQTLIDVLTKADSDPLAAVPEALIRERSRIRAEINRRENDRLRGRDTADINGLMAELDVLDDRIASIDPRYRAVRRSDALDSAAMRSMLDSGDSALQFFLGREQSFAWLIDAQRVVSRSLPAAARIDAMARETHERLSRRGDTRDLAVSLGDLLLGPFATELRGQQRVAIIADGALHYLPFETLMLTGDTAPLLDDAVVSYLPSLSTLALVRAARRKSDSSSIAVLADPVFSHRDPRAAAAMQSSAQADLPVLNRLALSGQEAQSIQALAGDRHSQIFSGFDANIDNLRSPAVSNASILHIAAHGFVDDELPARTGLALSMLDRDGTPRTGFVGLRDIYELRLKADLVVLSACDTALGANLAGEGILGLTRGFMYAGAARVVASLWQVEDRATAVLMQEFYRFMLVDGLSPAAALDAAKSTLRTQRRWRHPYYWSGFVLVGDAGHALR